MSKILAIETSCDETAAAVVADGRRILSNVVASQVEIHRRFGGVYPEVASRQHVLSIQTVIGDALTVAGLKHIHELDALAVTRGPGLAGSLLVGVNVAKGMAFGSGLPLVPVNHLEGHVYSSWLEDADGGASDRFPTLVLIVSGGHTELIVMQGHGRYRRLGGTLDDAAGEAFDKVARLLDLSYPGGPAIQNAAQKGTPGRVTLPRPLRGNSEHRFNFSFSGLKTAVLNLVRQKERQGENPREGQLRQDIASEFQAAVVDVLIEKMEDGADYIGAEQITICGGVSANALLRQRAFERLPRPDRALIIPPLPLCTDNAAMIAAAAHYQIERGLLEEERLTFDVLPSLSL